MRENLEKALRLTTGIEAGFTRNPKDPGNWTGRKVGFGELRGTKFGISAAQYPKLDIENLTLEEAKEIYIRDYWNVCNCDSLPFPIDCLTFDRCVLYGPSDAKKWAAEANSWDDILFNSLKHIYDHWNPTFARGWIGRIITLWQVFDKPNKDE
jgi:lysozyme family protein